MACEKWLPLLIVILVALALRLVHVSARPIGVHSWRQTDTAGVARNFAREGLDILHPRVDWRGVGPGYVQMELPVYPLAIGAAYRVLGEHEWIARLLSALGGVATVYFMYRLAEAISGRGCAFWTGMLVAVLPLGVYYGRAIMPESWMLASCAAGVWWMLRWAKGGSAWWLLPSACAIALAALLKLPALYMGLPILYLAWNRERGRVPMHAGLWVYAVFVLGAVAFWYWHAHRLYEQTGLSFGVIESGKWLSPRVWDPDYWWGMFARQIAGRVLTWPVLVLAVAGLIARRGSDLERVFDAWLIALVAYLAIAAEGNRLHEYYQLPFLLPGTYFAGRALAMGWSRVDAESVRGGWRARRRELLLATFALGLVFSGERLVRYWRQENAAKSREVELARDVAARTDRDELVVDVNAWRPGNPTVLYLADRKGWTVHPDELTPERVEELRREGARVVYVAAGGFMAAEDAARRAQMRKLGRVVRDDEVGMIVELD